MKKEVKRLSCLDTDNQRGAKVHGSSILCILYIVCIPNPNPGLRFGFYLLRTNNPGKTLIHFAARHAWKS